MPLTEIRTIVDSIKNGHGFTGMENLMSLVYSELDTVFDFLPNDTLMISIANEHLAETLEAQEAQIAKNYEAAYRAKKMCVEPSSLYLRGSQIQTLIAQRKPLQFKMLEVQGRRRQHMADLMRFKAVVADKQPVSRRAAAGRNQHTVTLIGQQIHLRYQLMRLVFDWW